MDIIVDLDNIVYYADKGKITKIDEHNWLGTDIIIADPEPLRSYVISVEDIPMDFEPKKYVYINGNFELNPDYES